MNLLDDLEQHVLADVKGEASPQISQALRTAFYREWLTQLKTMKRKAEVAVISDRADRSAMRSKLLSDPDGKKKWLSYVAERDKWASKNAWFLMGVETSLAEARDIRRDRVERLEDAIDKHRSALSSDPNEHDEELWRVLSN